MKTVGCSWKLWKMLLSVSWVLIISILNFSSDLILKILTLCWVFWLFPSKFRDQFLNYFLLILLHYRACLWMVVNVPLQVQSCCTSAGQLQMWARVQAGGWHSGWGWGGVLRCHLFPSRGVVHSQPVLMTGIPGDCCWHDLSTDLLLERYHRACKQVHPVVWPGGASQAQWHLKDLTRQGEMIYSVYTALNVRLSPRQCCLPLLWWTLAP